MATQTRTDTARGARGQVVTMPLMPAELQHEWDLYHATWFTLMGVGGGMFLVARLLGLEARLGLWLGLPLVDLVSFVVIGVGGLVLLWSLGRPLRFVRALLRPQTSWISRGAIADFVFLVTGALLVLPALTLRGAAPFAGLPWDAWGHNAGGRTLEAIAFVSAAVVIVYAGLVLADKAALTFWRSPAIPTQFVLSSLAMSVATLMVMQTLAGAPIAALQCWLLFACLALLLAVVLWHVGTQTTLPGKAESLARLHGAFRWSFRLGVLGAGIVAPMLLALVGVALPGARDAVGVVALLGTVGGGFWLRLLTLRVGYFPPVTGPIRMPPR